MHNLFVCMCTRLHCSRSISSIWSISRHCCHPHLNWTNSLKHDNVKLSEPNHNTTEYFNSMYYYAHFVTEFTYRMKWTSIFSRGHLLLDSVLIALLHNWLTSIETKISVFFVYVCAIKLLTLIDLVHYVFLSLHWTIY